jgi:hypothetical protein
MLAQDVNDIDETLNKTDRDRECDGHHCLLGSVTLRLSALG